MQEVSLTVTGVVEQGSGKARGSGFPTANLTLSEPLAIDEGIYCALASVVGTAESLPSVAFYGVPHALPNVTEPRFEVHVLDTDVELYGTEMRVDLLAFVRPNKKFETPEELHLAIVEDIEIAKEYFQLSSRRRPGSSPGFPPMRE